jgi:hypothetical protein
MPRRRLQIGYDLTYIANNPSKAKIRRFKCLLVIPENRLTADDSRA